MLRHQEHSMCTKDVATLSGIVSLVIHVLKKLNYLGLPNVVLKENESNPHFKGETS